ncbi:MAG: RsmE family RNA methyltransferase [Lacibacter sp.]
MALPFFYIDAYDGSSMLLTLNEETSKHVVQVLRMQRAEELNLTDGKGTLLNAFIVEAHKKNCVVKINTVTKTDEPERKICIAVSLVKNASRFEWFLEKATEIGVSEIVPLVSERTERQHFRYDRMKGIVISAMLQSQQIWLPVLHEPVSFSSYIEQTKEKAQLAKLIAHCEEGTKKSLRDVDLRPFNEISILIGPEGDFSPAEIELALQNKFQPVALGETRLRTETAAVVAATLLAIV